MPNPVATIQMWQGDKQVTCCNPYPPSQTVNLAGIPVYMTIRLLRADGAPAANEQVRFMSTVYPAWGSPSYPAAACIVVDYATGTYQQGIEIYTDADGFAKGRAAYPPYPLPSNFAANANPGTITIRADSLSAPAVLLDFTLTSMTESSPPVLGGVGLNGPYELGATQLPTNTNNVSSPANQWYGQFFSQIKAVIAGYSVTARLVNAPAGTVFTSNGGVQIDGITDAAGKLVVSGITTAIAGGEFTLEFYQRGLPDGPCGRIRFNVVNTLTPAVIVPISGAGQSVPITLTFPNPLKVRADNGVGTPMVGFPMTFTAPASGASCTFSGSLTQIVNTIAGGLATTVAPVANGVMGSYDVTVTNATCGPLVMTLTNGAAATYVEAPPLSFCPH